MLAKNLPQVIKASDNPANSIKEIIVVDDFSGDDSVAFIRENYPQIKVVAQKGNFGYARTCNTGVNRAENELVVILNADVVPAENFLASVLPLFADEQVFAVTFNEGNFGPGKLVWQKGFWEISPTAVPAKTVPTDWPNGGSSVFRQSLWQELGGMNELYLPFYFEDVDLGLRAQKAGYRCLWEPRAKVIHEHQATINPRKFAQWRHKKDIALIKERNHLLLTWQNRGKHSLKDHLRGLGQRLTAHPGYLKVVLSAGLRKLTYSA